jgi:periplasmic mercuric ion binding protein
MFASFSCSSIKKQKMKTRKFIFSLILLSIAFVGFAQTKESTFKVAGECGMCKKKIEKAAKGAGASYAVWNSENKMLTVKYPGASASKEKIEAAIAAVGYDTPDVKATEEAYKNLDECCQYERTSGTAVHGCCDSEKCTTAQCMKDGKCTSEATCCKDSGCDKKDCCKKA